MKDKALDMAREAGLLTWLNPPEDVIERFKTFEALVRADERNRTWTQENWTEYESSIAATEREACAKVCEEVLEQYRETSMGKNAELIGDDCAAAIRNRGNT